MFAVLTEPAELITIIFHVVHAPDENYNYVCEIFSVNTMAILFLQPCNFNSLEQMSVYPDTFAMCIYTLIPPYHISYY